ncbi:MAG: S-layer homology domain-containing protein [Clostridia bacterium]|nr:S-layer homology domain-containing protein [Clostridia bacterium]
MFKKSLSVILICITLISTLGFSSSAVITTHDITEAMTVLKNTVYPQNNYWCGGDPDSSIPYSGCGKAGSCFCNNFFNAFQCHGFALCTAQKTVGSFPAVRLYNYSHGAVSGSWTCYTKSALGTSALCALELQPGDIVRAANDSAYQDGHTAIVWKVEDGKVYFAEAWGSVYNKINWGGFNYSSYSMSAICSKYPYVALWRNTDVINQSNCDHEMTENFDAKHPHRQYNECSFCLKKEYTGKYQNIDDCPCCNDKHEYTFGYESSHPHYETKACSLCDSLIYTGESKKDYSCPECLGLPYNLTLSFSKETATAGEEITVNFSAENAVSYTLSIKYDDTKFSDTVTTDKNEYSFELGDTGNYTVTLHAFSAEGKTNTLTSDIFFVNAPITSVEIKEDTYYLTYGLSLSEEKAAQFTQKRGLELYEYKDDSFIASFTLTQKYTELMGKDAYTYFPVALSYHEILDFCRFTDLRMANCESAEENQLLVSLCTKASSPGILLNANDIEEEGSWVNEKGEALTYFNWHETYAEMHDLYRNYIFMYPSGNWTTSQALPTFGHGFVCIGAPQFSYNENEDGTLTLTALPVKSGDFIEIPKEINGKTVTGIGNLFFAHAKFKKIILPDSITYISDSAFQYTEVELFSIPRNWPLEYIFKDDGLNYEYTVPFEDISTDQWYYESLSYCYIYGYVTGTSASTFSPEMTCTREMFITVLSRVMKADITDYSEASSFTDVVPGEWYSAPIEWAFANNITNGIGDGNFGLGQSVTREQIAVFLSNLHDKSEQIADLEKYTDASSISSWAIEGMSWAINEKVLKGTSETTLEPKRVAMRTELCQMIFNYCEIFET